MHVGEENQVVMMIRESLADIPQFPLPPRFSLSPFAPGDEKHWWEIHKQTERFREITPKLFVDTFGRDAAILKQRQFYLWTDSGKAIGTGTAWFDDNFRQQNFGRVHWLAILPNYQEQGLSKPLMSTLCNRLKELGHIRAYLRTSTARIAAINLYLKFGFVPLIEKPEDKIIWRALQPSLKSPLRL